MIKAFILGYFAGYLIDTGDGWLVVVFFVIMVVVLVIWILLAIVDPAGYDPNRNRDRRSDD